MTTAIIGAGNIGSAVARHLTAGGEQVVLAAGDEADAAALAGTLAGLASTAPVKEAIQAADVVLFAATTGPRFSMTRHVQGTLDPPTPIRSGVLPRLHRFKDTGMVAAFADDGTVTHQSIGGTWHAPDELPENRRASRPSVRADR
jgi:nucleoside-diphosphate-sugar epimerase